MSTAPAHPSLPASRKVLVTGGCGYIGSHTVVELIAAGFDPVIIDSNARSEVGILKRIEQITGLRVEHIPIDLTDYQATYQALHRHPDLAGIIHFAAYKTVPESVKDPLLYYRNNLDSLVNLLRVATDMNLNNIVFSSSCSVYGNAQDLPVTEDTPFAEAESPYAATKVMGERILRDWHKAAQRSVILLRYFNPIGAHRSGLIGELPTGVPDNLVPYITQTGIGRREKLTIFGGDYPTRDGTCVRDYIHVSDIADAHVRALQFLLKAEAEENASPSLDIFNLGTGNGTTVLEAIHAFERASGVKLAYEMGPRRPGDVVAVYADNARARSLLGWNPATTLDEAMGTAWAWEQACAGK